MRTQLHSSPFESWGLEAGSGASLIVWGWLCCWHLDALFPWGIFNKSSYVYSAERIRLQLLFLEAIVSLLATSSSERHERKMRHECDVELMWFLIAPFNLIFVFNSVSFLLWDQCFVGRMSHNRHCTMQHGNVALTIVFGRDMQCKRISHTSLAYLSFQSYFFLCNLKKVEENPFHSPNFSSIARKGEMFSNSHTSRAFFPSSEAKCWPTATVTNFSCYLFMLRYLSYSDFDFSITIS